MHSSGSESYNEGTGNVHNEMQFISEQLSAEPCASLSSLPRICLQATLHFLPHNAITRGKTWHILFTMPQINKIRPSQI